MGSWCLVDSEKRFANVCRNASSQAHQRRGGGHETHGVLDLGHGRVLSEEVEHPVCQLRSAFWVAHFLRRPKGMGLRMVVRNDASATRSTKQTGISCVRDSRLLKAHESSKAVMLVAELIGKLTVMAGGCTLVDV